MTPPTDSNATPSGRGAGHGAGAAQDDFLARRSVKQQLLQELRAGWENGERVQAEELLPRWPGSPSADPDVASLLFEEYYSGAREAQGDGGVKGSATGSCLERPSRRFSLDFPRSEMLL